MKVCPFYSDYFEVISYGTYPFLFKRLKYIFTETKLSVPFTFMSFSHCIDSFLFLPILQALLFTGHVPPRNICFFVLLSANFDKGNWIKNSKHIGFRAYVN